MAKYFNKSTTYEEVKTIINEKSAEYYNKSTKKLIWLGLNALNLLENQERVISYAKKVDNVYKAQFMQKLPTILYGLAIMSIRPDFADKLSDDALMIYSHAYCHDEPTKENIDNSISLTTPEILEAICSKTKDTEERENLHTYAEHIYEDSQIQNKTEKSLYVCDRIKNMSEQEYSKLYSEYCIKNVMEELAKIGIKI